MWQSTERLEPQNYQSQRARCDFRAGYSDGFHDYPAGSGIDKRNPEYDRGYSAGRMDRRTDVLA